MKDLAVSSFVPQDDRLAAEFLRKAPGGRNAQDDRVRSNACAVPPSGIRGLKTYIPRLNLSAAHS